ncbi:MAG: hypothetical protein LUH14_10725 [Clostridiaceae bacterium]|nr:hypothetical protein [Clostridiaceae bacterium]
MFRKLLFHSETCGFLVLFSFQEWLLQAEDSKMKTQELELRKCVEDSLQLHTILNRDKSFSTYETLQIKSVGELFPEADRLNVLLRGLDLAVREKAESSDSFADMLSRETLFDSNSEEELLIPCGSTAAGGTEIRLSIGDRYPHYLVGGTTGSGKSNLLHIIIMNACWNYSPDELRIYLLDFKEGVEFSRYTDPLLPHAELVATEADVEYGISVLQHLNEELKRRYDLIKKNGCKNLWEYRKANPGKKLPRLLVIIDEFQVLFHNASRGEATDAMLNLARQGRACGIHLLLSTQSLKGVDFGSLDAQFSGRIALKCSAEDSRQLLGSMSSNNVAASALEVPYAILNTSQGNMSGNVKFAVPEAKTQIMLEKLQAIAAECACRRLSTQTKIFEGQSFPAFPDERLFASPSDLVLTLGESLDYEAGVVTIVLKDAPDNNVLFCGTNEQIRNDFLEEIQMSAAGCGLCEELIYIGNTFLDSTSCYGRRIPVVNFSSTRDFIDQFKDHPFDKKRLLILDKTDLKKEIGLVSSSGFLGKQNEYSEWFNRYMEDANKNGSHILAFYDTMNRQKADLDKLSSFLYRIGFETSSNDKSALVGGFYHDLADPKKNRAFLVENESLRVWFRPYRK